MKIIQFNEEYLDEAAKQFAHNYSEIVDGHIWSVEMASEYLERNLKNYPEYCFVALDENGNYAGDISCRVDPYYKDRMLFIDSLQVKREFREQGIAKELFEYVVSLAKQNGIKGVRIMVDNRQEFPKSWYKNIGFTPNGWVEYEMQFD